MVQARSDAQRFVQGCPRLKPAVVAPSPPSHASAKPPRNVLCLRPEHRATRAVTCSTAPLASRNLWRGARKLYPRVPIPEPLAPRQVLAASHPEWCQPRQWLPLAVQKRIEAEDRPWLSHMKLRFVSYTGISPLLQVPWELPWSGPVLVVSVFDGIGGVLSALLALGCTFSVICVEQDEILSLAVRRQFANVFYQRDALKFEPEMVKEILQDGGYTALLVVGGSPCQDLSLLNRHRQGLASARTQLFKCIPRIAQQCESVVNELHLDIPVFSLLENVAYAPDSFRTEVDKSMSGPPVTVAAGSFGWCKRTRCFWGQVAGHAMSSQQDPCFPKGVSYRNEAAGPVITWEGKKPIPEHVHFARGFSPCFEPTHVIKQGLAASPFPVFTRAFTHPLDQDARVSPEAVQRFRMDNATFPAYTYEQHHLLWKGQSWRQPSARERSDMMGLPWSLVQEVGSDMAEGSREQERARASAVGNSFHVPSIMLALILLFQLVPCASAVQRVQYPGMEARLRLHCLGAAWDPETVDRSPGLVQCEKLQDELRTTSCLILPPCASTSMCVWQ